MGNIGVDLWTRNMQLPRVRSKYFGMSNTFVSSLEKRLGAALNLLSPNHLRLLVVGPKCVTGPAGQLSAKLEFAFMC